MNELIESNEKLLIQNREIKKRNEELIKIINNQNTIEKKFNQYQKQTDQLINSHYEQLKTLFLYYDLKPRGLLKQNHDLNQELLNFAINVCDKYGLDYWLDCGTLLGATRHDGFIPWDDDVDIAMIRKDYNVFIDVIADEINKHGLTDYIFLPINIYHAKPIPIIQLLYTGGIKGAILAGLDVGPYDFIGNIENCNAKTFREVQKSVFNKNRNGTHIKIAVEEYLEKFNISFEKENYIIPGVECGYGVFKGLNFKIFDANQIYPLKTIKWEGKYYKCPNNPDYYLSHVYGDYQNIPKIIKHHHRRFENFENTNKYEIYEKHISNLKEINSTY